MKLQKQIGFEFEILFVHFIKADKGLIIESLEVSDSNDLFSFETISPTFMYL